METLEADDFSDLGMDVERHREALTSFARLNLGHLSVRPALRAREVVFVKIPSCRFAFGITGDPGFQEQEEAERGAIGFEVIHAAAGVAEAGQVRDEVERYFLRHFPGRTLPRPAEWPTEGVYVYVTCHAPAA